MNHLTGVHAKSVAFGMHIPSIQSTLFAVLLQKKRKSRTTLSFEHATHSLDSASCHRLSFFFSLAVVVILSFAETFALIALTQHCHN